MVSRHSPARKSARTLLVAGTLIIGVLVVPVALATAAQAASLTEVDFGVSSGYQSWTVPTGVHAVTMNVYGGAGGDGRQGSSCPLSSGPAGWVNARVPVTPGQTLSIWVGSGGHLSGGGGATTPDGTFGGGGGGGAGYGPVSGNGGGGGGATAIWASSSHREDNLLIVAGGGGGGGGGGGTASQCGGKGGTGGLPATGGKQARASLGSGGAGGPANQYDQQLHHNGTNGLTPPTISGNTEIGGGGGGGGAGLHDCTYDDLFDNYDCYGIGHGGINGGDDAAGNGGGGGGGGTSFTADSIATPFLSSSGASGDAGGVQISFGSPTSTSISSGVAHTGDTVALHAFVEASDGGGSVAFTSDGTVIPGCGARPFDSGGGTTWEATCSTSGLPAGVHEIAATYSGDDASAGSANSGFWTIRQATQTTVSTSPASPAAPGGTVDIDALVAPIDGGGTVQFTDDGSNIAGCTALVPHQNDDSSWHAVCTTATPDLGSHMFGAAYSGDSIHDGSTGSTSFDVATPQTVPGAPSIGVAFPGDASAVLSFSPPASDGGSPITGYVFRATPTAGGPPVIVEGDDDPMTVTGLTNRTEYTLTVAARNDIGTGPQSSPSNAVTPLAPLSIATTSLPAGTVGHAYSTALAAVGGTGVYTWSLDTGSGLPAGLTLHTNGTISGTPTAATAVPFEFVVKLSDGNRATVPPLQVLKLTIGRATVTRAPDLAVSLVHQGRFVAKHLASYKVTVHNTGNAPTSTATTVTVSLPSMLTATSASGSGWTCTRAAHSVRCHRSAGLAAGASRSFSVGVRVGRPACFVVVATSTATVSPADRTPGDNRSTDRVAVVRR